MLDAMRGIAAICVAAYHMSQFQGSHGPFDRGYLAVDFFFILSGLVLTPIFETPSCKTFSPSAILRHRILRFWPLMAFGAATGFLQQALASGLPPPALLLIMAFLFVPLFAHQAPSYPINGPQWSLTLELVANTLHLYLLRRLSFTVLVFIVAGCWFTLCALGQSYGSLNLGHNGDTWLAGLARMGFGYVLGSCLARSRGIWSNRLSLRHGWWMALGLFAAALALPVECNIPAAIGDVLILPALGITAALAYACKMPSQLNALARWLGAISFPLYAIHYPLLQFAHTLNERATPEWQSYCYPAAAATALLAASLLARTGIAKGPRRSAHNVNAANSTHASARPPANLGT